MELFQKILRRFIKVIYQYSVSLDDEIVERSEDFGFREIKGPDIDMLRLRYPKEMTVFKENILKSRINDENIFSYFVTRNDQIVGYYHLSKNILSDSLINYKENLDEDVTFLFDDYTFLAFRGLGGHKYSINLRKNLSLELNFKSSKTHIMKGNGFSERAYMKCGFVKSKRIIWINILFKRILITKVI